MQIAAEVPEMSRVDEDELDDLDFREVVIPLGVSLTGRDEEHVLALTKEDWKLLAVLIEYPVIPKRPTALQSSAQLRRLFKIATAAVAWYDRNPHVRTRP